MATRFDQKAIAPLCKRTNLEYLQVYDWLRHAKNDIRKKQSQEVNKNINQTL